MACFSVQCSTGFCSIILLVTGASYLLLVCWGGEERTIHTKITEEKRKSSVAYHFECHYSESETDVKPVKVSQSREKKTAESALNSQSLNV